MTPSPADHAQLEAMVIQEVERRVGDLRKELKDELNALRERTVGNRATMVVFSGDLDGAMAALVIATGAASSSSGDRDRRERAGDLRPLPGPPLLIADFLGSCRLCALVS
jgi:hypothetical protein